MEHIICLTVGDWSLDGHEKTSDFYIKSSLSSILLKTAFKTGVRELQFDITEFCEDYEDNTIPREFVRCLENFDYNIRELFSYDEYLDGEEIIQLQVDEYVNIYLFTVKLGRPDFEYSELNSQNVDIGGYGLFH